MRKILSIFLCISMLISLVPFSVGAAENSDSNQNALEMFGFPLDPDSYDTQALKKGTYPISPAYELYVDNYNYIQKYSGSKQTTGSSGEFSISTSLAEIPNSYVNQESAIYSVVTGFSASGTVPKQKMQGSPI